MPFNASEAREQCQALFNNMAFADVVMAADHLMTESADGTVTTRKVAAALGLSDSVVRPVMVRLVTAQLLDELPKVGAANGPRLFHRRNGDRWTATCSLITMIRPPEQKTAYRRAARRA